MKLEAEFTISQNYGGAVEASFKHTFTTVVEIIPKTESTATPVVDEKQRNAIEKSVKSDSSRGR
ncbi:MAG: hypothetical protein HC898_07110 [Phycisphaerales bacterium]|nr:hypothetical protein [Phycisphaerales bacterium]